MTAVSADPHGAWVTRQDRNVTGDMGSEGSTARFLVRDREAKCVAGFDEVFQSDGA